ncbi:MAG TPA: ATP-dependent DNA helicase [Candidatus Limnocylindria bacterium]|nr:ATP-dependent DNA helicase [Candidatus Limnocylindria bacterium]
MSDFAREYKRLNAMQKKAVDATEGPLLVIAGPGTGKTQLLSARVANILKLTDSLPSSILCLTFTEAAALNMRERLRSMIGEDAYGVHINTYHSFASDIIRANPDFFETVDLLTGADTRMERPINDLGQLEIVKSIVYGLPFTDPLRGARYYLKSVVSTISDLKQANIDPEKMRAIAKDNARVCLELSPRIHDLMSPHTRMPGKAGAAQQLFTGFRNELASAQGELADAALKELDRALESSAEANSTKPLTAWKNSWLQKDDTDRWCFTNPAVNDRLLSLATIYEKYQEILESTGQYDFNDMILRTLKALQEKPELKFNLQEQYQYILLDEFQDTNAVQFELVRTLADHPVHEGRPNIMAVGDDDQGIFAFQGADIGNMIQFLAAFRDVEVINLVQNYRSHHDILHVAHNIAEQIESRIHHSLDGVTKNIEAAASDLPDNATIARHEFTSAAAENGWIADQIAEQIENGVPAHEIAVLAPKHAVLETLVPFLNKRGIPVTYEKRENIFETPVVQTILLMCELLRATARGDHSLMDQLLPRVLSLDFWQIPIETIWQLNWDHARQHQEDTKRWVERTVSLPRTAEQVKFLLRLGTNNETYGLELTLDYLTGAKPLQYDHASYTSPLKQFYFSDSALKDSSLQFYEAISHLSVIRAQLREQQAREDHRLDIDSLLDLYETYQEAEQPLINTHPIAQAESSVQLQTVYKAKGLEYEHVYLTNLQDDVWGSTAKGGSNKLSIPANLKHIRHDASTEDTLRRLLFVAVTRAKHGLVLTSHAQSESGKKTQAVKYLQEFEENDQHYSGVLPDGANRIFMTDREPEQLQNDVDTLWHSRHTELTPTLKSLLGERLERYVMSPTHLNTFTNVEYSGPMDFLLGPLLRFPKAPTADSVYGDAVHRALEQYQKSWKDGRGISIDQAIGIFEARMERGFLSDVDRKAFTERGKRALRTYLAKNGERLRRPAEVEFDFRREGCVFDQAVLTGKMDRLEVNQADKTVRIIDFKSGSPSAKWGSDGKHINYKQQLYFYNLLIETSRTFKGYKVNSAALEFIEPLPNGESAPPLELRFDQKEYDDFKRLLLNVWQRIHNLDLPDISGYPASATGVRAFIKYLLA